MVRRLMVVPVCDVVGEVLDLVVVLVMVEEVENHFLHQHL